VLTEGIKNIFPAFAFVYEQSVRTIVSVPVPHAIDQYDSPDSYWRFFRPAFSAVLFFIVIIVIL